MFAASGKYRLDQRLGGGGMAEVFLGSTVGAEGFSRKVAIKRVLPGFSDNEAFARMFVAEAQISSMLQHPNIVSVLDFDRDLERRLFLVMELVEGKDLDGLMSSGLLPLPVVIYVIGEVLRGLGYAHDLPTSTGLRGVVHRDISPHNVLLSWEGAVKVSDFGIAKARAASEATASVFIKGKPAYMSPEQANGQGLDGRSDLFAVGIMLWEMLIGRRLFVAEDTRATLAAVLFGQIPRPRSLRADIPKDLERVAMKLLDRDLNSRYASAEAALADLLACADAPKAGRELLTATLVERFTAQAPVRQSLLRSRQSLPPGATPPGAYATPAPSLGAVMNAPTHTMQPVGTGRGRSILIIVIAAAVTIAIVVVAIVAGSRKKAPDKGSGSAPIATQEPRDAAGAEGSSQTQAEKKPPPPPPPDAADPPPEPRVLDAAPPPDAAPTVKPPKPPVTPPKKDETGSQARQPEPEGSGMLIVRADPPVAVSIGATFYGDTPQDVKLKAGNYQVRLFNAENRVDELRPVTIKTDGVTKLVPLKNPNK